MIKGDPNQPFNEDLASRGGQFYLHVHRAALRERGGAREAPEDEAVQEGQEGAQRAEAPRAEGRGGCGGMGAPDNGRPLNRTPKQAPAAMAVE